MLASPLIAILVALEERWMRDGGIVTKALFADCHFPRGPRMSPKRFPFFARFSPYGGNKEKSSHRHDENP